MDIREQIMEATIEEFNENGLKFTMDNLAKRLRISKKTLYSVFSDKETLFLETVDVCFASIKESENVILSDDNMDIIEKIRRIIIVLPERYNTIDFRQLYELRTKYPQIYTKIADRIESDWEPTLALLKQAMDEGRIKNINLYVFKEIVSASIEHFIGGDGLIKNGVTYTQALEEMIDILIDGIRL